MSNAECGDDAERARQDDHGAARRSALIIANNADVARRGPLNTSELIYENGVVIN